MKEIINYKSEYCWKYIALCCRQRSVHSFASAHLSWLSVSLSSIESAAHIAWSVCCSHGVREHNNILCALFFQFTFHSFRLERNHNGWRRFLLWYSSSHASAGLYSTPPPDFTSFGGNIGAVPLFLRRHSEVFSSFDRFYLPISDQILRGRDFFFPSPPARLETQRIIQRIKVARRKENSISPRRIKTIDPNLWNNKRNTTLFAQSELATDTRLMAFVCRIAADQSKY